MNKGLLNESLLDKDIEQINLYATEEKETLKCICNKFLETSNSYKSTNTALLLNVVNNLKGNIGSIYQKRVDYVGVLNKAISSYNTLSNKTVTMFEEDVER